MPLAQRLLVAVEDVGWPEEALMASALHYAKTTKGVEEIGQRRNNLRGKMRTMLILIDRAKSADELKSQAERIGVPPDFLEVMVREGYVTPIGGGATPTPEAANDAGSSTVSVDELNQFRAAKSFMNETVVNALGIRAFMFTLRLERCANRTDLGALMPDYHKALRKVATEPEARAIEDRMLELLA